MYAIVEIAGQQFKVAKDQKVFVHRLQEEEGESISFDKVLLTADGDAITVGAPVIEGAQVSAKVLRHLKGDKVIVFKKKRRKGYRVKNGHRQYLTEISIEDIVGSGAKKSASKKKATPKVENSVASKDDVAVKAPVKTADSEIEITAASKKAPAKKTPSGDDLKKIEGVGPKAAEALMNAGIDTFAKLAKADPANIKEILAEASSRLKHLEPGTWPQQADLAANGKWDELKVLQDELDGGK